VDWQQKGGKLWMRYFHLDIIGYPLPLAQPLSAQTATSVQPSTSGATCSKSNEQIRVGDRVRFLPLARKDIRYAKFFASSASEECGIVTKVKDRDAIVDFSRYKNCYVSLDSISLEPSIHPGVTCGGCKVTPICGPRFKCKVCLSFDYCQQCFYGKRSHPHTFLRINEAGVASIFAGKPGRHREQTTGVAACDGLSSAPAGLIEEWSKCVKQLNVSSLETWSQRLVDGDPTTFWQSCGSQGKHWILLEMHVSVMVQSLKMVVSSDDGSYMPSKLQINVGNSTANMKELKFVDVDSNATYVTLLSDIKEYFKYIEISILECRNGGVDCRVHGLYLVGRHRANYDPLVSAFCFLASDSEDLDDTDDLRYGPVVSTSGPSPSRKLSSVDSAAAIEAAHTKRESPIKVYVWGLNDKDQLGGHKGSKLRVPVYSENITSLRPSHIVGGSKCSFIVSQDGKVYACGEGNKGRLGLGHSNNVSVPQQLTSLSAYVVKKVAIHSGGQHVMALTVDGKVFSWGEGDDGKLGHGNKASYDKPKLIEALKSKRIKDIACGSSHSAAITSGGELYTWGLGEYGRLGHGDTLTQLRPKMVKALEGWRVIQVACGSKDAQTLALTETGQVFSWGDGDYGKLGRGGSDGCNVPQIIETLDGQGVSQIVCGAQFSIALTKTGEVLTWGKGDYFRLGHNSDKHVRKPTVVEALRAKKIVHVASGALHCLAVTDTGQVYAWGDNDHGQVGNGIAPVNRKPTLVQGLEGVRVAKVACGSSHSVCWTGPDTPIPRTHEAVLFTAPRDPLGNHSLGKGYFGSL
jgi:E3 ubiquitin-protein ligase HERC2